VCQASERIVTRPGAEVGSAWSLGFLGRFQYASVSYEDGEPYSVLMPGVLFVATYN
jgi:hypothetical protein